MEATGPPWLTITISTLAFIGVVVTALVGPIVVDRKRSTAETEVRKALDALTDFGTTLKLSDHPQDNTGEITTGEARSKASDNSAEFTRLRYQIEQEERRTKLIREYATQGLAQSRLSFMTSLCASVAGFFVIMFGAVLAIFGFAPSQAVIPVVGGAVINATSLLLVAQDRRNQSRMFDFFERLREDRKLDESLELLRVITDAGIRSRMQATLALHFSGIDEKLPLLETMISDSSTARNNGRISPPAV